MLTAERLCELLHYDPVTGIFTWKVRGDNVWDARWAGKQAGHVRDGYLILKIENRAYLAHRVAWLMHFGVEPPPLLDHRDGDGTNCRIKNLRQATYSQNSANSRRYTKKTSLPRGVSLNPAGRYQARVTINKKQISLGVFSTPDEAHAAYLAGAVRYHGEFARAT